MRICRCPNPNRQHGPIATGNRVRGHQLGRERTQMTANSGPESRIRTKCRATRRPALKFAAFADSGILLHTQAHVSERPGGGGEGGAQHFNEVKDERKRVRGHRNPAHRTACLRAPVEAANPQYGVVLVQVVPGPLRRRYPAEDCSWVWGQKSANKTEKAGARARARSKETY